MLTSRFRALAAHGACVAVAMLGSTAGVWAQDADARYRVQALASEDRVLAEQEARRIHTSLGGAHGVYLFHSAPHYAVRVGDFPSASHARRLRLQIRALGYADAWLAKVRDAELVAVFAAGELAIDPPGIRRSGAVAVEERRPADLAPVASAAGSPPPVTAATEASREEEPELRISAPKPAPDAARVATPTASGSEPAPARAAAARPAPALAARSATANATARAVETPGPSRSVEPSPPAPRTAPNPASGAYHGVHEAGDCDATFGWAWDADRPDAPVTVEILDGARLLGRVVADRFRSDLKDAGKGDGRHGFSFHLPAELRDGKRHQIRARIAGTGLQLLRTPVSVDCPRAPAGEMEVPVTARNGRAPAPNGSAGPNGAGSDGGRAPSVAGNEEAYEAPAKRMTATRLGPAAVTLDGRLDDEAWTGARFVADFQQKGPDRGFPARERTEVAFLYDDDALYIGARMHTRQPEELRALVRKRDDPGNAERILVSLDTYHDRRTAYTFGVTSGGVRLDYFHPRDDEGTRDDSFDPVWEARAAIDSAGWTAEMRIPFSELRFGQADAQTWGLNVRRWSPERFLNTYWVVVPLYETGWASRFGELVGLERIRPARRLAVRPYMLGGATFPNPEFADPADPAAELETRFGGDVSFGLGPNLTLEATVNPDFGQVEADPADVNLTQFETFFDERRPFFVEGGQLFRGRGPNYFYSRRIGSVPLGGVSSNVTDPPLNASILTAAKITGRLESGLTVGGLAAVTEREMSLVEGDSAGTRVEVAPLSAYAVGRVERELGPAGSRLGFTLTGVNRSFDRDSPLEPLLPGTALTGGGDWSVRLPGGDYEVDGYLGFSHVGGDSAAINRVQRSSARYFQRPDATHVTLDPSRTSLSGWTGGVGARKLTGQWLWEASASYESPGFELQDAGILPSSDDLDASLGLSYRQPRAGGPVRDYSVSLFLNGSWNTAGLRQYTSPSLYTRVTWPNLWRSFLQVGVAARATSDDLTRGGPRMGTPLSWNARGALLSRFGAPTQWSASLATFFDELGGWSVSANGGVLFRPGSQWELSVYPGYTRSNDSRQFFGVYEGGSEATFGQRYVFSFLDRSEIYSQFRAKYSLTPDLSVELYAEPFASSGRFRDFGELIEAGGRELRMYGTDGTTTEEGEDGLIVTDGAESFTLWNSDFRVRSFRSNAVLRWEWQPGSTFHLIWQQSRWLYEARGDRVGPATLLGALGDSGEHVLVAKVSYWLQIH